MKPHTLSVSAAFYDAVLRPAADARGLPVRRLVEKACAEVSTVDIGEVQARMGNSALATIARAVSPARAPTAPRLPGPRLKPEIVVDEGTAEMLADAVVRARVLHGRTVTEGEVLDAAINAFLDELEKS